MKTYRWIIIVVLMLSLGFPAMTASAKAPLRHAALTQCPTSPPTTAAMILTSPAPNPIQIGGELTFVLVFCVANVSPGVTGAEIYLTYDPRLVAPPDAPGVAVAEVLPDFFGVSNFSINEKLPAGECPGTSLPCVHLVLAGPAQTYQSGIAARFHFYVLDFRPLNIVPPPAAVTFAILPAPQSSMVNADGAPVSFIAADPLSLTILNRTTTGTIHRQGLFPATVPGTLACASVTASGTWPFGPMQTNITGSFNFDSLPNGTYTVIAVYPGYLNAIKKDVVIANNALALNIGTTTLRGGDIDGNGVINILDIGAIIAQFNRSGVPVRSATSTNPPTCGNDDAADINDDGVVNIGDLAIAAGNWAMRGPTSW